MRFAVETHGCRLNQAESDAIVEQLRARGHRLVAPEHAQLFVLNSCAITSSASADARAAVRRARRRSPDARVVITGCHANLEPEQLAAMPELDAVVGNVEKRDAELFELLERVERVERVERAGQPLVAVERLTRRARPKPSTLPPASTPERTRPLLAIQDGCDYQCSFCIVPRVRGRSRSAPLEQVRERLAALADAPEVVLTGAHLGTWGRDLRRGAERPPGLADLLAALLRAHPGARLRLGSVDPHEVGADLVALLGAGVDERGAGLCPHVHLPVQSGDDEILAAMRRAHRVGDLDRLIVRLRPAAPDIGLRTDLIVGFPGEREPAFERTLALFESRAIPFAHVFTWSPRSGTPAATMGDRVAPEVAARRSGILREQVGRNRRAFARSQIGAERSAVILRRRDSSGALRGLTDNYLKLCMSGADTLLGRRVRVRLEPAADPPSGRGADLQARVLD